MTTAALCLAAGKGTRMRSARPKVLAEVAGTAIAKHLLAALASAGVADVVVVIGHGADEVRAALGPGYGYALQVEQRGMAHAVAVSRQALDALDPLHILVTVGDSPLVRAETFAGMMAHHERTGADCTFLTAEFPDPPPYARVIRAPDHRVLRCVEEHSATAEERQIRELLTSHFVFRAGALWEMLPRVQPSPVTGELYLTDIVGILLDAGRHVEAVRCDDWRELVGLNTPEEVRWAEGVLEEWRA